MFIEALKILAERKGFRLSYELFHDPGWYAPAILESRDHWHIPFARLKLTEVEPSENGYDEAVFLKRRTSRLNLYEKEVPAEAIQKLKKITDQWRQRFEITTDPKQIEKLMNWNTVALFEDLNTPSYRDEIVEWFRYTDREAEYHRDGLDYRCMNTPRLTFWMSAKMSGLLKIPVAKQILGRIYRSQLGTIPTLGIIAGGFWEPSDAIETGKFLMRFWLETAVHNLYIHPYGNLVTNRKVAALVEGELGIADIWLIFKIGYSDEPPKSKRLPLEKIIVQ